MIPPFGQPKTPDFADELLAEASARVKARREREGMSEEQLMKLRKQIGKAKEREDWESVRELSRTHYQETGAGGGA